MKLLTIVTPCFNEEGNLNALYAAVRENIEKLGTYRYEHVFIDNASTDGTQRVLRELAENDRRVKVIFNNRNFGYVRSCQHGLLQGSGDAVLLVHGDLQDPPSLIPEFVRKWEAGAKVVMGIKTGSAEPSLYFALRGLYYKLMRRYSDVELVDHFTGFGLYDRAVIEAMRKIADPYPYFRGLISYLGFPSDRVEYVQPTRKAAASKFRAAKLYDLAMLGMTTHSKAPLRFVTVLGLVAAILSFLLGFLNLVVKLLYWDSFVVGLAPVAIGLFFIGAVQLFFLGIIGEYIGFIYTQVLSRPLVIERERLNFE